MDLQVKINRRGASKAPDLELDIGRYELRRDGHRVKLEKKPMELLLHLVRRRDQMVSRDDIAAQLWRSDLFIDTERNINNIVRKLRRALGDEADRPRFLETVVGKGYRFVGPIRVIGPLRSAEIPESANRNHSSSERAEWQSARSSLAVLPLRLLGAAQDEGGITLGFADALVSRLANLEGFDVLPTSTVLNVPENTAISEIASNLGVRFVLHGAIQTTKGEARLSVELFDSHRRGSCFVRKFVFDLGRPFDHIDEIASVTARTLKRPLQGPTTQSRYSRDPLAYAEFIQGYRRCATSDSTLLEEATQPLMNAVARDPGFALAHAVLSYVCAKRHFETDPSRSWLEKAEFHCQRALELDSTLPEGHVARSFLLWGPSRNFQHIEAIAELKRALSLQKNLPHAYSRLGTILAHVGLLDHSRAMFEMGRPYDRRKTINHSVTQVFLWSGEYELATQQVQKWRQESPDNKYARLFALELAISQGEWPAAKIILHEAGNSAMDEPLVIALRGVMHASRGESEQALECVNQACTNPKSFGHAHHTYYQIARILSLLNRPESFDWLERSVDTGFACWPFFLRDPCLSNLRQNAQFELLVSSLQAKYPDHLGLL
jgi:DNA-binding winged helix-turn-helix (wHTH) protein/tetratricopeptide (TPR) repeat protein